MDSFLFFYAREGTTDDILKRFRTLLYALQDVDSVRDSENNTLLHAAVSCSNVRTVNLLIERGADIQALNKELDTPLSLAKSASKKADCTQNELDVFRTIASGVGKCTNSVTSISKEDIQKKVRSEGSVASNQPNAFPSDEDDSVISTSNVPEREHRGTEKCESKGNEEINTEAEEKNNDRIIDFNVDDLESLAGRLGVKIPLKKDTIILSVEQLKRLNNFRDDHGYSLLTKFTDTGNLDVVNFLLKCEGIDLNARDDNRVTAAQISWCNRNYECLLTLLLNDSNFPFGFLPKDIDDSRSGAKDLREFVDQRTKLHRYIESGNLDAVKEATKFRKSFLYLNVKNESALYCAGKKKEIASFKVFAYLKFVNLRYRDDKEGRPSHSDDDSETINRLMDEYSAEHGNSHILKLAASTKVLGKFTEEQERITDNLYKYLDKSAFVSMLMKVVKYENFQASFDFERENIERVYQGNYGKGCRGMSDTIKRRIYIGAKECFSQGMDSLKNVAGTVAHELCHVAVDLLYGNDAKPYKKNETEKLNDYENIVSEISTAVSLSSSEIHEVIARVFKYRKLLWHAELIVRVPHILAMFGDIRGEKILVTQVPKLYDYYKKHIVPHCGKYSERKYFKNELVRAKDLKDFRRFVEEMETAKYLTKNAFKQLEEHLISYDFLYVIVTSNVSLSCSLIYHHLKLKYYFHFDKCCLFFELNAFINNFRIIQNAYKSSVCDYLVLFTSDASVDFRNISGYFFNHTFRDKKKNTILIVRWDCKDLKPEWKDKILNYQWKDLTDSSKKCILGKNVTFQGKRMKFEDLIAKFFETNTFKSTTLDEDLAASVIQPEELSYLIDEGDISIGNTTHLNFPGDSKEYYMERKFARESLKDVIYIMIEELSISSILPMLDDIMEEMKIPKSTIQTFHIEDCTLLEGRFVLLKMRDIRAGFVFERISRNWNDNICIYCYNFRSSEYYTSLSDVNARSIIDFWKSKNIDEVDLITFSDNMQERVVIISDEPGAGKSTVVADIIGKFKEKDQGVWTERIDLNDFADGVDNPVGLAHLESMEKSADVIEFFMKMAGLKNCLERTFFKMILGRPSKMKLFFDGFDEISPSYKHCVLKLLHTLIDATKAQIWITTRKHEREDLEDKMNTFSYKLEQLSVEDQAIFMGKFWKHKMKFSEEKLIEKKELDSEAAIFRIRNKIGDIVKEIENYLHNIQDLECAEKLKQLKDELEKLISFVERNSVSKNFNVVLKNLKKKVDQVNLASYAAILLVNMPKSIVDNDNLFTGVPLLLSMVAVLAYDKNLKFDVYFDTYTLYTDVIREKIVIYLRGKSKSKQNNQYNLIREEILKSKIYELHETFASKVIQVKTWDADELTEIDKELMLEVGIVVQIHRKFSFVHRTFADFFYCQWMLTKFRKRELIVKELEEVLSQPQHVTVRHFLNDKFKISKGEEGFGVPEELVEKINFNENFLFCVSNNNMKDCVNLWQDVVIKFEKVSDDKSFMYFLNSICSSSIEMSVHAFQILSGSLSDDSLIALFDSTANMTQKGSTKMSFVRISRCSTEAMEEFLYMLKRLICIKSYKRSPEHTLGTSLLGPKENVDRKFEEIKFSHGISETVKLLEERDSRGDTLLLTVSRNKEYLVFFKFLTFFEEILGKDQLGRHLSVRNNDGMTLLHYCSISEFHSVECDSTVNTLIMLKTFLDEDTYIKLIKGKDNLGYNFLHNFVWKTKAVVVNKLLSHLDQLGANLLKEMFVAENNQGMNILHPACNNSDIDVLKEVLSSAKRIMNDNEFLEFVKSRDKSGNTIFHTRAKFVRTYLGFGAEVYEYKTVRELNILKDIIDGNSLLELMTQENKKKETFLHISTTGHLSLQNCYYAADVLDCTLLEEFLSKVNSDGDTFLHKLGSQKDSVSILHALFKLREILPIPSFTKLTEIRNRYGENVLHIVRKTNPDLHDLILKL